MQTIGFAISQKENERRRALIPADLAKVRNTKALYFQESYGEVLGFSDDDYRRMQVNVGSREIVYDQPIICSLKAPEPLERVFFEEGQKLFAWIHAIQGRSMADFLLEKKMSAIAWEEMFEHGRHVFWRNNELAGEAAVQHAFLYYGRVPYECSVGLVGKGNTAKGAMRTLERLGTKTTVYDKKTVHSLRSELGEFDVIVNCVLWDVFRQDRLIYREDLKKMRTGAMIIDISCDENLEIETSRPTTIDNPVYYVDGILHYAVDHTASLFWKTASESISSVIKNYVDDLVEEKSNEVLDKATVIKGGTILDERIIKCQGR